RSSGRLDRPPCRRDDPFRPRSRDHQYAGVRVPDAGEVMFMRMTPRRRSVRLGWERLEDRLAPSLTIQFDYSLDSSGFFLQHPAAKTVLQEAADVLGSPINDSLSAIAPDPGAGNTWTATFINPSDGSQTWVDNLGIPSGAILVYAGGFTPIGSFIGFGG